MPSRSAVVLIVTALMAWCAGIGAAAEPGLSVVAQSTVGGRSRVIADPGRPLPASAFSVSVDGATQPLVATAVISDRLAAALVVDASASSAPALPAGLSGIADFALGVPPAARTALVADTTPPAVVTPLAVGPSAVLGGLSGVAAGGERRTAEALDLAVAQLPPEADAPRLVVMWTGGQDAGGPSAADLAARLRAAGVVLAVAVAGPTDTAAPSPYWSAVAAGTGGVAVTSGPAGAVKAFTALAAALRQRCLLTFPAPARLPARALVQVEAPGQALTAEAPLTGPAPPPAPAVPPDQPSRPPILLGAAAAGVVALMLAAATGTRLRRRGTVEGRPGDRAAEPVSGPRRAARDRPADHRAWHVPARGRPVVNRALLLEVISGALDAVAHGPGGPVVVVPEGGRAGVGVTTAMIEFTHRHADAYDVVWWISARDPQLVPDQLAQLAEALGVAGPTAAPAEAMRAALAALRGRGGWLVVFDDAESVEDLVGVLPAGPGHVLVGATRPGRVRRRVTVPSFTRAESVRLLQVRHPGLPDDEADVVARRLDDLPVAVDVAGAAADPSAASASGVWAWVFDQLEADDPPAMALLTLLAWLGPDPVPMWLVADDAGPLPTVLAGTAAAERAPTLERRALALVGADGIRVHPVLAAQLVNRTASARPDGASWAVWAVRLLRAAVPADVDDPANRSTWRRLMPHVLTVTDPSRPLDDVTTEVGWLLHHAGEFVTARGAAASARALFEDARELGYRPQERTLES